LGTQYTSSEQELLTSLALLTLQHKQQTNFRWADERHTMAYRFVVVVVIIIIIIIIITMYFEQGMHYPVHIP
jgi:hypothetical protein